MALPTEQVRTPDAPAGSVGAGRATAVDSAIGIADPAWRKYPPANDAPVTRTPTIPRTRKGLIGRRGVGEESEFSSVNDSFLSGLVRFRADYEVRTRDLLFTRQMLYQLS